MIDNTSTIVEYDPGFAIKYLKEKEFILQEMIQGDGVLYETARRMLVESKNKLKVR